MALTVTATFAANDFGDGVFLGVRVLTGAAASASQPGASYGTSGTSEQSHALTTTVTGSMVFGLYSDALNNDTSPTAVAGTTLLDNSSPSTGGNGITFLSFRDTSATGTPGSATRGFSGGTSGAGAVAMAEILASGTIALDSSAPSPTWADTGSGSSVTSASFTPPAGSLLVAIAGADANTGHAATDLAVTDSSGLTWKRLAFGNGSSGVGMIAAVYVADVPAGGGTNASAGSAAGTGAANAAVPRVSPAAGSAAGTGAAQAPVASVKPAAGLAAGTGTGQSPAAAVSASAGLAAGTGTGLAAVVTLSAAAGAATGTGTGQSAAVAISAAAGNAAGTGAAAGATASTTGHASAPAGLAAGTGAAGDPAVAVSLPASLATGTGAAQSPAARIGAAAGAASGSGAALAATVSAAGAGSAPAGLAAGTGAARDATAVISGSASALAGLAAGSGTAWGATSGLPSWPDVERAVCDLLAALGTCGLDTRPSLQATLPYLRVTRTGGSDDGITDAATVSVDVFAPGASLAKQVAEQARQLLIGGSPGALPARATGHGVVDRVITVTGPVRLPPTDSGGLRMVVASYRVSMRRG